MKTSFPVRPEPNYEEAIFLYNPIVSINFLSVFRSQFTEYFEFFFAPSFLSNPGNVQLSIVSLKSSYFKVLEKTIGKFNYPRRPGNVYNFVPLYYFPIFRSFLLVSIVLFLLCQASIYNRSTLCNSLCIFFHVSQNRTPTIRC